MVCLVGVYYSRNGKIRATSDELTVAVGGAKITCSTTRTKKGKECSSLFPLLLLYSHFSR